MFHRNQPSCHHDRYQVARVSVSCLMNQTRNWFLRQGNLRLQYRCCNGDDSTMFSDWHTPKTRKLWARSSKLPLVITTSCLSSARKYVHAWRLFNSLLTHDHWYSKRETYIKISFFVHFCCFVNVRKVDYCHGLVSYLTLWKCLIVIISVAYNVAFINSVNSNLMLNDTLNTCCHCLDVAGSESFYTLCLVLYLFLWQSRFQIF